MKYTVASLFAGIGGIDLGFKQAGAKVVWANEIDPYCAITFKKNYPKVKLEVKDICEVKGSDIPHTDILVGGFPCQPFSVAGYRKGFSDDRGNMFFQIVRLIQEMEQNNNKPKAILLENVKNLKTHNHKKTYETIKNALTDLGYFVDEEILNTCEYGNIPQNRERLFIVGFLDENKLDKFNWPKKIPLKNTIDKVIDWNSNCDDKYFYTEKQKCYDLLKENVTQKNTIYQYRRVYVRANKNGVCPTLTANMGMGGHNVPIILDSQRRIRKLTPRECLLLQGFPKNFIIPEELSDSKIYKQAGNAVSVNVVKRVAKEMLLALKED